MAVKVRAPGLGSRVRARRWAFDDHVVHLTLADQTIVPHLDEVRHWIDTIAGDRPGVRAIRTGALFPAAAARFADAGFSVIDTLALLRNDLFRSGPPPAPPAGTTRLPVRRHREASAVDRAAFGDPWGVEHRDLGEIRHATPSHRAAARYVAGIPRRRLVAFAISGAAGGQGYLQRLAVDPPHQREGHGRALVLDALAWMHRRRLDHGVVNTAEANAPALALYESLGFRRLPEQLVVMQCDVADEP